VEDDESENKRRVLAGVGPPTCCVDQGVDSEKRCE
jgi:hypothetical protein